MKNNLNEEEMKILKNMILYSDLLYTIMIFLGIHILGMVIWGIIEFIFSNTYSISYLSPFQQTVIIMLPIIIAFFLGIYFAIKFSLNINKLSKIRKKYIYKNIRKNLKNNLSNAVNVTAFTSTVGILKNIDTNDFIKGLFKIIDNTTNIVAIFIYINSFKKNKKYFMELNETYNVYNKKVTIIYKILIYFIAIICSLIMCGSSLIGGINGKKETINSVNKINTSIIENFSDYKIKEMLDLEELGEYGGDVELQKENKEISMKFDSGANINEIRIAISNINEEELNHKYLLTQFQAIENKIKSLNIIEEYKTLDVEFDDKCIKNIKDRIEDTVSVDIPNNELIYKYFKLEQIDSKLYKVEYIFLYDR